jgi:aarF domain-containing kinase
VFLTEANAERLAVALCRMRGAALKLGQMLSIQDESVVPPAIARALERVREGADVMPASQLNGAMETHLGKDWRAPNGLIENGGNVEVVEFSDEPLAAASIGQVHRATVRRAREDGSGTFENLEVCMKIQYPGVARSIHSDIDNLVRLVSMTDLLPRGLYVEHAVATAKEELTLECDYEYELASQEKMRALLADDPAWTTPRTIPELSSAGVLTTTFAPGVAIDKVACLSQSERDYVATQLLRATLRELFEFRFMQSDPNFANFLYCRETRALTMIDFGAAKTYPKPFVDEYLRMVVACAELDREGVIDASIKLGFLTGEEAAVLLDAHVEAGFQVGRPFRASDPSDPNENAEEIMYDFGENRDMTRRVAGLGKVMLKHRLTPPPAEAYSLHRKLSGSFLACMRLRARVPARALLMEAYRKYDFTNERAAETDAGENDTPTLRNAVA